MNRSCALVLIIGMALVAGCGSQPAAPAAPAAQPAAEPAPAAAPGGQPAAPPATTPAVSAESVAGLPDYPGAVRISVSQRPDDDRDYRTKTEAKWTSTDPFATVTAYYQKAITERGWTVTSSENKRNKAEWKLAKGTSTGKVEVELGDGTQVVIKIERADR